MIERMVGLYNELGLDTSDNTINKAEIVGICAGLDIVQRECQVCIDENMISKEIAYRLCNLLEYYDDQLYDCVKEGDLAVIYEADYNRCGKFVIEWFNPFNSYVFTGNGISWAERENLSWKAHQERYFRWSMLDSMEEDNE